MLDKKTTSEPLGALSDGVFAVILMVLDLRPPDEATLQALIPLWPLMLSNAVIYLFIAIIWVNHHHLLHFAPIATPGLIWWNFAHLFMVSPVPVATAWMAATRLAAAPVFIYAFAFVLIEIAYLAFEYKSSLQATEKELPRQRRTIARVRSGIALAVFTLAAIVAFHSPRSGLALVCCVLLIYLSPRLPDRISRVLR